MLVVDSVVNLDHSRAPVPFSESLKDELDPMGTIDKLKLDKEAARMAGRPQHAGLDWEHLVGNRSEAPRRIRLPLYGARTCRRLTWASVRGEGVRDVRRWVARGRGR
jgi:hypothetical protein